MVQQASKHVFGPVRGYTNRGSATLTAGNTYVDVSHYITGTPTNITVTPSSNLGTRSFWVSDVGASTFRININSSDIIDYTFYWSAEV